MDKFCCLKCGLPLKESGGYLACDSCGQMYPVKEGVPFFTSGDYYFPDISESDMDSLLEISRTQGWKAGFHDFLRVIDESAYKIAADESRLDWRFLFDISKESAVLDLGSGFGGISLALSQRAGKVVAMDCSLKRLKLLDIRVKQEGIDNIVPVCGGDSMRLPFPDKSFDLVVLNGVLEWLAIFNPNDNPRDVQLAKLKDIHRILKDNGSIYIGIENRIGYVYFLGGKDHNNIRFTNLMPRWMANMYSKIRLGQPYLTYTYSISGYKRLLRESGYSCVDIYATIPSYRDVFFMANVEDTKTMDYFFRYLLRTASLKRKIIAICSRALLKLGVFKFFIPEYGIIAKKNDRTAE